MTPQPAEIFHDGDVRVKVLSSQAEVFASPQSDELRVEKVSLIPFRADQLGSDEAKAELAETLDGGLLL